MKKNRLFRLLLVIPLGLILLLSSECKKKENDDNNGDVAGSITDIDGNTYQTITAGSQEWMAENLKVTKYKNGDPVTTGLSQSEWDNTTNGAYSYPDNNVSMGDAYGLLYNWYAATSNKGLCPEGWHVPTHDEWTQFTQYLIANNSNATEDNLGILLKSCRKVNSSLGGNCSTSTHPRWDSGGTHDGTDAFGFAALPGGVLFMGGFFDGFGHAAVWWTTSEVDYSDGNTSEDEVAWFIEVGNHYEFVFENWEWKASGCSVRCVRNL